VRSVQQAYRSALITSVFFALLPAGAQKPSMPSAQTTVHSRDVSMDDYRQHLSALSSRIDGCAEARNVEACDPSLIGPDDRISIVIGSKTEQRLIRYGWLRVLFSKAEDPDNKPTTAPSNRAAKPTSSSEENQSTTSQLLKDAKARLESDLAQSRDAIAVPPDHQQELAAMREVLARPEFRNLQKPNVRDSILEKIGNWLNRLFESAANLKARSAWVGRLLVGGFILAVCVALVASLIRLERRWRVRLTPDDNDRPAPGAPSARDWQLWLEDARQAAASGHWREAIHFVYWAAISRLESRRLWPADRARTPREYLALVGPEDPRKPGLSQLTGTFERFWYGGRTAGESEYRIAEHLASSLISGNALAVPSEVPAPRESGAR
jgi:hypothetical protein